MSLLGRETTSTSLALSAADRNRFHAKVLVRGDDECWPWQDKPSHYGYGRLRVGGRVILAHRIAYALAYGPPPACVLHTCDFRMCCNPRHLFNGTRADNVEDAISKQRHVYGIRVPQAKLTDALAIQIRDEYAAGGVSQTELARRYGVHQSQVCRLVRGRAWRLASAAA